MRFRLVAPSGEVLDEGEASAELAGGALLVSPTLGPVLRVAPADIVAVDEPEPYVVRLVLAEGPALELDRLGTMRTQLLAELREARATGTVDTLLLDGIGHPEIFPGWVDGTEAELRLYDDALVVLPVLGEAEKVPYPFIRAVTTDPSGYRIGVEVAGRAPLELHRLASRTTEFVGLLGTRHRATAGRTAAFLGALLPGLGAVAARTVAGILRDGLAGARADLDAADPTVWPALAEATTLPDRAGCLASLAELGTTWIGFKQIVSVERPAEGVQPWRDPAITPDLGDHGANRGSFGPGFGGMLGAGLVAGGPPTALGFDGPFQAMGSVLAYRMLGLGGASPGRRMVPRADVTRGRLVPAHTDLAALAATGEAPTVLAFALCLTPSGTLVYEVLNAADHATYLYRAADADGVAALNRALDLVGFRVAEIHADTASAGSRYRPTPVLRLLRSAFVGRVAHTDDWAERIGRLSGA
jgi:hypothetical protein